MNYSTVSLSEYLSQAIIENVGICNERTNRRCLAVVGDDMDVCDICRSFGSHVTLQVEDSQDHRGTLGHSREISCFSSWKGLKISAGGCKINKTQL